LKKKSDNHIDTNYEFGGMTVTNGFDNEPLANNHQNDQHHRQLTTETTALILDKLSPFQSAVKASTIAAESPNHVTADNNTDEWETHKKTPRSNRNNTSRSQNSSPNNRTSPSSAIILSSTTTTTSTNSGSSTQATSDASGSTSPKLVDEPVTTETAVTTVTDTALTSHDDVSNSYSSKLNGIITDRRGAMNYGVVGEHNDELGGEFAFEREQQQLREFVGIENQANMMDTGVFEAASASSMNGQVTDSAFESLMFNSIFSNDEGDFICMYF
jgi:hypothetical protein